MAKSGKKRVKFEFKGNPGSQIFVAGTFNDWDSEQSKLKDRKGDGTYTTRLLLPPGRHEYKLIVNGNWRTDPNGQESAPNNHGSLNSVITVA